MYKTRNTGTGNGMRGTQGMGECCQIFRGMSLNISENVAKHSGECRQIFQGMPSKIPGNVIKHSGKCPQTFQGMLPNIPGTVANFWCKGR